MNNFVNIFKIDDAYIREYATCWTRHILYNFYNRILCFCLLIFGFILIFVPIRFSLGFDFVIMGAFDFFIGLILLINYFIYIRKTIKTIKARTMILAKDICEVQNEINGISCIANSNLEDKKHEILLSFIIDHFESKNFYFLIFFGEIVVSFKKNGFILGNFNEFKNFIKVYPKKKKIRPIILGICLTVLILISLKKLFLLYKFYLILQI